MIDSTEPAPRAAISISEFCQRWGIGRTKAYQLINEGRLKAVKLGGGTTRILATDEAAFAKSLKNASQASAA